jgi:hypothetical protein
LTLELSGAEWLASRTGCFIPGKEPSVPIGQDGGWAPEPVLTFEREEKSLPRPGIEPKFPGIPAVFARPNAGVVGSIPTRGMGVCVYSVFV